MSVFVCFTSLFRSSVCTKVLGTPFPATHVSWLASEKVSMSRNYSFVRRVGQSAVWVALVSIGIQIGVSPRGHAASAGPGDAATVRGIAWNSDNSPIPNARVRLRNTHSGRVEANTVTAEDGHFGFNLVEGGSYVVELVGDSDRVMAVGQSFRVEAGETVATFVRLPPRRPRFAGLFTNAAAAAIAAAASVGVTAMGPTGSGSRPISPQ